MNGQPPEITPEAAHWVLCPFCGGKTRTKLLPNTELRNYPLFCPKCKRSVLVNAEHLKLTVLTALAENGK